MATRESVLRDLADQGNVEKIKTLLADDADPNDRNSRGFTALFYAMTSYPHNPDKDHLAVVKTLVEAGADVNVALDNRQTPLVDAAAEGLDAVVEYLVAQGADPKVTMTDGWNCLHYAAAGVEGRPLNFTVTMTREDGQPVTLTDPDAIREAIGGHPDDEYFAFVRIVDFFIRQGVDVNAEKRDQKQTPLFNAAGGGSAEICALLLLGGANADHRDRWLLTPLHYACREGGYPAVGVLLEQGANVNAADDLGFTPLHEATMGGYLNIVKMLIDAGADPALGLAKAYQQHKAGATPLDVAKTMKKKDMVDYLSGL